MKSLFTKILLPVFILLAMGSSGYLRAQVPDSCKISTLPFTENFETVGASRHPCWQYLGSAQPYLNNMDGNRYLYLGATSSYIMSIMPVADASVSISDLQISFSFKGGSLAIGTPNNLIVGIISDPSDISTFIPIDTVKVTETTWKEHTSYFVQYTGVGKYIAFQWHNNGRSSALNLDNITVSTAPDCIKVRELSVNNITDTTAYLSWNASPSNPLRYIISYRNTDEPTWIMDSTPNNYYTLRNLSENSFWEVKVASSCAPSQYSEWDSLLFLTRCMLPENDSIGKNKISENGNLPAGNFYSYSQQIFTAAELKRARDFNGIAFQYFTGTTNTTRKWDIYFGHTSKQRFDSNSDFIPVSSLTKVFSGIITLDNSGDNYWFNILFDTLFAYNGTENLVIVVHDYTGLNLNIIPSVRFYTDTINSQSRGLYNASTSKININSLGASTLVNYRSNIKFMYCGNANCLSPDTLWVDNIASYSADISWFNNGWEYESEYKKRIEEDWTFAPVSNASALLTGLQPGTLYDVRVRTICNPGDTSSWISNSFTTECGPLQAMPYSQNFDLHVENDYPNCWSQINNGTVNQAMVKRPAAANYHSAPSSLYLGETGNGSNYIILPRVDDNHISINLLTLQLWAKTSSVSQGELIVGVMSDSTSFGSFTAIDTIRFAEANSWEDFDIPLYSYSGSGTFVALLWKNSQSNNCIIDDVVLTDQFICFKPAHLSVDSLTPSSAFVSWTDHSGAAEFVLEYGKAGFARGNGYTDTVSSPEAVITGLKEGTVYDLYVTTHCSPTESTNYTKTSFTTLCSEIFPYQLPYTEGFDSVHYSSFIPCWIKSGNISLTEQHAVSLKNSMVIRENTYTSMKAVSDSLNITSLSLSFALRAGANYAHLVVGVMDDPTVESTFNPIKTIIPANAGNWENITVPLHTYSGNGQYITFKLPSSGYVWIDDVIVNYRNICSQPENLLVSNLTSSSATVSWDDHDTYSNWVIEYDTTGFVLGTGRFTGSATSNSFSISGLDPETSYDFYVRLVCSATDSSEWSLPLTFTTACGGLISIPYNEDFDSYTGTAYDVPGVLPGCWYTTTDNLMYPAPHVSKSSHVVYAHSAPNSLSFTTGTNGDGANAYAVLPAFDQPLDTLVLSFYAKRSSVLNGKLYIGYIESTQDRIDDFQLITEVTGITTSGTLSFHVITLKDYTIPGTAKYIAFKWVNSTSTYQTLCLDNVAVDFYTTCEEPVGVTVGHITDNSAVTSWGSTGDVNQWEVKYKALNSTGNYTSYMRYTPNDTLRGLLTNTSYIYLVRSVCSPISYSQFDTITFTTEAECITPADLVMDSITHRSGYFAWTPQGSESSWIFRIKKRSSSTFSSIPTSNPYYKIDNLDDSTLYDVCIVAECGYTQSNAICTTFTTLKGFTVSASADSPASITPSGNIKVARGGTITFAINGNNYNFDVRVNGESKGMITSYTFSNIQGDSTIQVYVPESIPSAGLQNSVLIYPNPAHDVLTISMSSSFDKIEVINLLGNVISSDNVRESIIRLNTSSYRTGVYFIRLTGKEGTVTKKFIKQ